LAVGVGTLAAAVTDAPSPIDAVGSRIIARTPQWLERFAVDRFGTNDKLVLRIGIVTVLAIAAALIGRAAATRPRVGDVGFLAFGIAGFSVPSVLGALVGAGVLRRLLRSRPIEVPGPSQAPLGWDRRRFLVTGGATAVAAAGSVAVARMIEQGRVNDVIEATGTAPTPTAPVGAELSPSSPFITPNDDFFRIDTALSFPRAKQNSWNLRIEGMVDTPLSFSYAQLQALPQVERMVTMCCVSNDVGDEYVGNAVWRGVLLADLLRQAGVQAGAQQVFSTSLDGWTSGFPVELALDGRDAMVALGMNGAALPLTHGWPARLVVPGLYGYVSATKWLRTIELTTWDREGYWVPRGWARLGPVKTQSRIDVPRRGATLATGPQKIAGIAFAQHTGIAKVEVRIDGGAWQQARLGTDVSDDVWRQWVLDWQAPAGTHSIEVRATDKSGYTQTDVRTSVAPDGATGHHTIDVNVA